MNDLGYPAQVLPSELERLQSFYGTDVYRPVERITKFDYGQRVTPKEGPFAYHVGRYEGKTKRGDAALFQLFGQEQRVLFKKGSLIAA